MHTNIISELDVFTSTSQALEQIDRAAEGSSAGVIVRGSAGSWWHRADELELLSYIDSAGLLRGHSHYCEPGYSSAADEAVNLMGQVGALRLGLGIWLELGELGALAPHELSPWLSELIEAVQTSQRRVAVMASPQLLQSIVQLPAGTRLITRGSPLEGQSEPWARTHEGEPIDEAGYPQLYTLSSARGLFPERADEAAADTSSSSRPVVDPAATRALFAAIDAPAGASGGSEGSQVPPGEPGGDSQGDGTSSSSSDDTSSSSDPAQPEGAAAAGQ